MKSAIVLHLLLTISAYAADWPQWLGPNRNGISNETDLHWPATGPEVRWRIPLGQGFSGISNADGRIFTMFAQGEDEYAICLDTETGSEIWRYRTGPYYQESQGGDGPRSTPTVDDSTVYILGATGRLSAHRAASGTLIWERDLSKEFNSEVPKWGFSTSPLVEGDLLLVEVGGTDRNFVIDMVVDYEPEATAVALDKDTGETIWTALNEKMSYSSPIAFTAAGERQIAYFTAYSLTGLSPIDGKVLWRHPWKTRWDVSASTPIYIAPDRIFISTGDDSGGAVFEIEKNSDGLSAKQIWQNKKMKNHFGTSILYEGHLYGFDNSILKCLDAASGEEQWKTRGYAKGTLIIADGHLIVLGEGGELGLIEATPTAFIEKTKVQILNGRCWTVPSIAEGRIYIRNESEMVSLEVAP